MTYKGYTIVGIITQGQVYALNSKGGFAELLWEFNKNMKGAERYMILDKEDETLKTDLRSVAAARRFIDEFEGGRL